MKDLIDLWSEVLPQLKAEFIAERKAKPWRENLFLVPIFMAAAIFVGVLVKWVWPDWLTRFLLS